MMDLTEKAVASERIYDGKVVHLYKDTVLLPDGSKSIREYVRHGGAVCVLPLLENGDVLLERQFRYALGTVLTEIPAGKLDDPHENPRAAALRELREETGACAGSLTYLGPFIPACAYSTEVIHMFLARELTFGERSLDEDEFLNVSFVPMEELVEEILQGRITDGKTQLGILKASMLLKKQKENAG